MLHYGKYMQLRKNLARTLNRIEKEMLQRKDLFLYALHGRKPWTPGYFAHKWKYIAHAITDSEIMDSFRKGRPLPHAFGSRIDERVVEYPWLLSVMPEGPARVLDAGSALNFETILDHPQLIDKKITIVNLNPEPNCFWRRGVSYVFTDMRALPFLPNTFDIVTCVSTLEHVGMDNTAIYTKDVTYKEHKEEDYLLAIKELERVLAQGGKLFLTVPFGTFRHFGFFQQFNQEMLQKISDALDPKKCSVTFFAYTDGAWHRSSATACAAAAYTPASIARTDPALPAAAGAVACLTFTK